MRQYVPPPCTLMIPYSPGSSINCGWHKALGNRQKLLTLVKSNTSNSRLKHKATRLSKYSLKIRRRWSAKPPNETMPNTTFTRCPNCLQQKQRNWNSRVSPPETKTEFTNKFHGQSRRRTLSKKLVPPKPLFFFGIIYNLYYIYIHMYMICFFALVHVFLPQVKSNFGIGLFIFLALL